MPQFKVAKTKLIGNLPNEYSEDTLYLVKNKENYGELYYDYDSETRIKLSDSNQIYECNDNITLNNGIATLFTNQIKLLNIKLENGRLIKESISLNQIDSNKCNIFIGQFVLAPNGIFMIKNITNSTITVIEFYLEKPLEWTDI